MVKYRGKTIIQIAHGRGANGHITKKATAWKYLLSTIHTDTTPLHQRGERIQHPDCSTISSWAQLRASVAQRKRAPGAKAKYREEQWIERIERNGDALCHAHGYLLRTETQGELLPKHLKYRAFMIDAIEKSLKHTYSLSTLPRSPQDWNDEDYYLCIAGRTIIIHRSGSASWDNPRSKWPSSTSITRKAYLLPSDWDDLSKDSLLRTGDREVGKYNILIGIAERTINYEARGNWLLKIITELLGITPERQRGLSHIQLNHHYRVERIRKIFCVEIWKRTLAGETIDYCAVHGKDTYHAVTPREAVHGLAAKLATPGSRREIINMDYALSLGFCRTGVEQFCDDYDLDCTADYSRAEIQSKIRDGNGRAEKYSRELTKAGFTVK